MLTNLILFNFNSGFEPTLEVASSAFILKTCQRTILVSYEEIKIINLNDCDSYEVKKGKASYLFLLEVICGLKSKLLGENEIVSQFKSAYKEFIKTENLNTQLLLIIEKLFKDTKEIRTKYLIGLGQKTYASITRRKIVNDKKQKKY
jgi:glutamyl-tRNA reductase